MLPALPLTPNYVVSASDLSALCAHSEEEQVSVAASGEGMYSFLCALLWPFVDSYYVAALILFSLQVCATIHE